MKNPSDTPTKDSSGYNVGLFTAYTLLLIFISAVFVTPISILTTSNTQTQFISLLIFTVSLICMTLMISYRSGLLIGMKFILIILPIIWLILLWIFVVPQISNENIATSEKPTSTASSLPEMATQPATSTVNDTESPEISVARIAAYGSVMVAIIGVIGVIVTAWANVRNAQYSREKN